MNDDQRDLASAALDGALTDEERARADADPEVQAEIARFRTVRDAIRDTGSPDPVRRDTSLAAALAAFDALGPAAPVVPLERRPAARWMRPALAAAAALVVVVAGVAILDRGGDDQDDSSSLSAADAAADAPAGTVRRDETLQAVPQPSGDAALPSAEIAPTAGTVGDTGSDQAGGSADTAADAEAAAPAADDPVALVVLVSAADLVAFAEGHDPLGRPPACGDGMLLGPAIYVVDDRDVVVDIVLLDGGATVGAVAVDGCATVARAPVR